MTNQTNLSEACLRSKNYNKELLDLLANLEHEQWSHWTDYYLKNDTLENRRRWKKQVETPYSQLSNRERESDKQWANKVLAIIYENLEKL